MITYAVPTLSIIYYDHYEISNNLERRIGKATSTVSESTEGLLLMESLRWEPSELNTNLERLTQVMFIVSSPLTMSTTL